MEIVTETRYFMFKLATLFFLYEVSVNMTWKIKSQKGGHYDRQYVQGMNMSVAGVVACGMI